MTMLVDARLPGPQAAGKMEDACEQNDQPEQRENDVVTNPSRGQSPAEHHKAGQHTNGTGKKTHTSRTLAGSAPTNAQ